MNKIGSVNQVRDYNIKLVKNALKSLDNGTKNTVAQITGLSIATCNTLLNELAQTGEILEVPSEAPTVGRPPKMYCFNADYAYVCCVFPTHEESGWRIHCHVMNLLGETVSESSADYAEMTTEKLEELLMQIVGQEPKIHTISFGNPGYYYNHQIHSRGAAWLDGYALVEKLEERLSCKVYIENDVNAMAYGLYYYGKDITRKARSLVLLAYFTDQSIGSGIVINGEILRGSTGFAGEIGKIQYPDGDVRTMITSGTDGVVKAAATAVQCYCATVNPEVIVFTGAEIEEEMLPRIREQAAKYIPEEHIPKLVYGREFQKYYIWGLAALALEE